MIRENESEDACEDAQDDHEVDKCADEYEYYGVKPSDFA